MKKEQIYWILWIVLWYTMHIQAEFLPAIRLSSFDSLPEYTSSQIINNQHGTTYKAYFYDNINVAIEEIDDHNTIVSTTLFHDNGTQTKTTYHTNQSKTIETFGQDLRSTSRTEINAQNLMNLAIEWSPDNSYTKTIYHADQSATKEHFNTKHQLIATTEIDPCGVQITAETKLCTAWHEAGHTLSCMHHHSLRTMQHVTIQPDTTTKSLGHVLNLQICAERTIEQLENDIITYLCGGASEQILFNKKMLTNHQDILDYFSHERYTTDIQSARQDAREIIQCDIYNKSEYHIEQKIDLLIAQLYYRAYQFLNKHQDKIKKIAHALMQKTMLSSDDIHELMGM